MAERLNFVYNHHAISVTDIEKSIEWYEKVFDGKVVSRDDNKPLQCLVAFVECGGAMLELFEYYGEGKRPTPPERRESMEDLRTGGTKHVCYETNLPRFFNEKVDVYNVDIDYGPGDRGNGDWFCFIKDPDGILYELFDIGGQTREPHAFDNRKIVTKE
mgnify:CR=1 FL=1